MDTTATKQQSGLVIVRLLGGLGNQMFQYALGRHLSIIHNRPLKLDLSFYQSAAAKVRWAPRNYNLAPFNIRADFTTADDIQPFKKYLRQDFFSRALRHSQSLGKYYAGSYIFEPRKNCFVFDPRLLSAPLKPTVYLDGFWQTEKYFKDVEDIIRADFTFKNPPDEINQKMLADIGASDSVALHIRHGDNATKVAAKHGVLPLEYYSEAVKGLIQTVNNPHFYIFSDDPGWAKENLKLNYPATFVTHNGDEKNYEDLRLMSACKHHIIGNSTFSWWGAWLGKKPNQIVYAPKRYHIHDNIPTTDLYPQDWKLINN